MPDPEAPVESQMGVWARFWQRFLPRGPIASFENDVVLLKLEVLKTRARHVDGRPPKPATMYQDYAASVRDHYLKNPCPQHVYQVALDLLNETADV